MEVATEGRVATYKITLALSLGVGFAALLLLVLKVLMATIVSMFLFAFLAPGGLLTALVFRSREFGPPLAILAANALIYSAVAYVLILAFLRKTNADSLRRTNSRLAPLAVILLGLACIPMLNPLWPLGITDLTRQERELEPALPLGLGLDNARRVLSSKEIQFHEDIEKSEGVVLQQEKEKMIAVVGDRVISARLQTAAAQFPCGYDIEIVLLFGLDEKMVNRHIRRMRVCP